MVNLQRRMPALRQWTAAALVLVAKGRWEVKSTIAILLAVTGLAVWVAPRSNASGPIALRVQRTDTQLGLAGNQKLAVFTHAAGGATQRVGHARTVGRDVLSTTLYDGSISVLLEKDHVAALLPTDVQLLWAVASDANKAEIRRIADGLIGELQRKLAQIVASDDFRQRYQLRFVGAVRNAAVTAIDDPKVKQAFTELPLAKILEDKNLRSRLMALFASNGIQNFMNDVSTALARRAPSKRKEALDDPELKEMIAERFGEFMRSDAVANLLAEFARPFLERLFGDPELMTALQGVATDPAFAGQFAEMERKVIDGGRQIVRLLVGVDRTDRMHPLAATVLRGLLYDNARWLVAVMKQDDLQKLREHNIKAMLLSIDRTAQ